MVHSDLDLELVVDVVNLDLGVPTEAELGEELEEKEKGKDTVEEEIE